MVVCLHKIIILFTWTTIATVGELFRFCNIGSFVVHARVIGRCFVGIVGFPSIQLFLSMRNAMLFYFLRLRPFLCVVSQRQQLVHHVPS